MTTPTRSVLGFLGKKVFEQHFAPVFYGDLFGTSGEKRGKLSARRRGTVGEVTGGRRKVGVVGEMRQGTS